MFEFRPQPPHPPPPFAGRLAKTRRVALCQCSGNPCAICNRCSCCDPEIMAKLTELAEGRAPNGCYLESSPRVRAAAGNAIHGCEEMLRPTGPAPAPLQAPPERRQPTPPKPDANRA